MKKNLIKDGFEVSEKIGQLKLKSQDGKYRMTDVCDIEGMFRIIESIPSKNAEPIKQWLAHLGKERVDETFDPSIALQRAIDLYRTKGYDEEWIAKRMKSIQERKKLTDVWKENGIESNIEYAILDGESDSVEETDELLRMSPVKFHGPEINEVGNYCIVGHNYRNSRFFSKVPTLVNGDIIQIVDFSGSTENLVEYEVYDKYEVVPEDTSCTSQETDGKTEITLITCTNDSQKRVIVKARKVGE